MQIHIKTPFTEEEIDKINAIFYQYPDTVANIARHIFDLVPYEESVYAVYSDGVKPYGLKVDIIEMYDKEYAIPNHTHSLPWVLLSSEEDIRSVCEFVLRHIADGTFDVHELAKPKDWVSMIDGTIHSALPWTMQHFKPYTAENSDKYPYTLPFPSLDD